ncbi:MAG: hypothetical protein JRJ10_14525, partial [Deltaproteobacteria bacterium]|nr:hypothetical protein [Deltaproteobacteria bacterium]
MDHRVPLTNEGAADVSEALHKKIAAQKVEIESIAGVKVTGIRILEGGAPTRFWVSFGGDRPLYHARAGLENLMYDVG